MRDRMIRIHWAEPMRIEDAIASPLSKNRGLYYITRMFGTRETSLYIGKATRTIRERIREHNQEWVQEYRGKIYVRIGRIIYPAQVDAELIDHAESALIYQHKNLLLDNTDKRYSYSYSELYRIENTGAHFELDASIRMHTQE